MTPPPKNPKPHTRHIAHHVEALAERFAALTTAPQTAAAAHYAASLAPEPNGTGPGAADGTNGAQP